MKSRLSQLGWFVCLLLWMRPALGEKPVKPPPPVNKLLYMYRLFYLPFSVEFREGKTKDDILPFVADRSGENMRVIRAEELQTLDSEWNAIKDTWRPKSLVLGTTVPINQSVTLTSHLMSHRIAITRTAFDQIPLTDRIVLGNKIKDKPPEVQAAFKQLTFLRSFMSPFDNDRFTFFIVSASWCDSCREYRMLLESYLKTYPKSAVNLHSVVIEDTKEEIFEKALLKELFPNPKKYSHESVPRFLAVETVNGKTVVLEEGDALKAFYDRYLKEHKGYLDAKSSLFQGIRPPVTRNISSQLR